MWLCPLWQRSLTKEQQAHLNKLLRDLCMTDKDKIFIAGLFVGVTKGAADVGGATGVGCFVPDGRL